MMADRSGIMFDASSMDAFRADRVVDRKSMVQGLSVVGLLLLALGTIIGAGFLKSGMTTSEGVLLQIALMFCLLAAILAGLMVFVSMSGNARVQITVDRTMVIGKKTLAVDSLKEVVISEDLGFAEFWDFNGRFKALVTRSQLGDFHVFKAFMAREFPQVRVRINGSTLKSAIST